MTPRRRRTGPAAALLFPGAGSAASHSSLVAIEAALAPLPVRRADFPYRREGRRAPDRAPKLLACVLEEAGRLAEEVAARPDQIV
ncbi:MAG: dienelactone hydrolase, partial [Acidimicrobiales bacterium]